MQFGILCLQLLLLTKAALQTHRHHGRHQEEDAGDEAGEGQCYGQSRHPGTAE